jgi:hypothetical protein
MAETTRGRTDLWTNRYMDELVYGRIVSKAHVCLELLKAYIIIT